MQFPPADRIWQVSRIYHGEMGAAVHYFWTTPHAAPMGAMSPFRDCLPANMLMLAHSHLLDTKPF